MTGFTHLVECEIVIQPGDTVAIVGAGPIGLSAILDDISSQAIGKRAHHGNCVYTSLVGGVESQRMPARDSEASPDSQIE
jgi:Zn-dependent alcohol dehydrogenase